MWWYAVLAMTSGFNHSVVEGLPAAAEMRTYEQQARLATIAVGKFAIGLYLGQASVGATFGAAGSLVVFMVWIYYASLILFLGAEITRAITRTRGKVVPVRHARTLEPASADAERFREA